MGEAARKSGIPRNEVFLTTKILTAGGSAEKTYKKCLDSVHKIDGEKGYVDLFLLHTPSGGPAAVKEMYQALEKLENEGKVKSIGVSNFGISHIEEMKNYARIWPPHVNQIEVCTNIIPLSSPHRSSQVDILVISLPLGAFRIYPPQSCIVRASPFPSFSSLQLFLFIFCLYHYHANTDVYVPSSFTHGTNKKK